MEKKSKVKLSRSLGIPLTPKAARVMERRSSAPGQHGATRGRRPAQVSDYKRQLVEKQRLKAQYNIHERQMRNYFRQASSRAGNTADNLSRLLETRLDAVVHRGGLAPTIYAARQYVSHGHVQVDGKRVTVPGYQVRPGNVVSIEERSRNLGGLAGAVENAAPPEYLSLSRDDYAVRLVSLPDRHQVPVICEFDQVIEFYSR